MDSKYATLPWRAIISTAPGIVPLAMSSLSQAVIRSSRSAERPTSAGFAVGRLCAATPAASASRKPNDTSSDLIARILSSPCSLFGPRAAVRNSVTRAQSWVG